MHEFIDGDIHRTTITRFGFAPLGTEVLFSPAPTVARAQENLIYTMTAYWPAEFVVGHSTIAGPAVADLRTGTATEEG